MPLPFDLDNVFAYKTPKVVRIRDRRLGIARILITIAIFVYVVIYEAILQQGYLLKEVPQGAVITNIRRPTDAAIPSMPSYCRNVSIVSATNGDQLLCEWMDEIDVLYPAGEELGSLFVTTRISRASTTAVPSCNGHLYYTERGAGVQLRDTSGSSVCPTPKVYDEINDIDLHYYVGEIERFTMMWSHAVYGEATQNVEHNTDLHFAKLDMPVGDALDFLKYNRGTPSDITKDLTAEGYRGTHFGDLLSVQRFLEAAALHIETGKTHYLDSKSHSGKDTCVVSDQDKSECGAGCHWVGTRCSDITSAAACGVAVDCTYDVAATKCRPLAAHTPADLCATNSLRYDGAVFLVLIDYSTPRLKRHNMGYSYKVRFIPKAEYKIIQKVKAGSQTHFVNRHGLRILFVQTGFITKFSFVELLKTLVAGVTLFAVAGVLVEQIIMKILPEKHVYENYKFTQSEDFSVVQVTDDCPLGGLRADDFIYGIHKPGGEAELSAEDKGSSHGDAPEKQAGNTEPASEEDGRRGKETVV